MIVVWRSFHGGWRHRRTRGQAVLSLLWVSFPGAVIPVSIVGATCVLPGHQCRTGTIYPFGEGIEPFQFCYTAIQRRSSIGAYFPESASEAAILSSTQIPPEGLRPVSKGFITLYTLSQAGWQLALTTPLVLTLALKVQAIDPVNKANDLSLLLGVGGLISILVGPVVGLLSDHTSSRFGKRRPWMFIGLIGMVVGLVGVALSSALPLLLLWWCIASIGGNMNLLSAVMPDHIPEQQRGSVSGLSGIAGPVGTIAGTVLATIAGNLELAFLLGAALAVVLMLPFILRLSDRPLVKEARQPLDLGRFLRGFWISPRAYPDFAWSWLGRFLIFCGIFMLSNYIVYYLTDHLHIPTAQVSGLVAIISLLGLVFTVAASIVGGILSDRFKRRKIFVLVAGLIYSVGIVIVAFAPTLWIFLLGTLIGNLALGVYVAVDQALVTDVLPNRETEGAKGMGIFNIAQALPQSLAPAIAPLFLAIGGGNNYTALYLIAGIIALLGAFTVQPIGKQAESSDKSERGGPVCPNLRPKNDGPKVRHDFQFLADCGEYASLFRQKMHDRFRILTLKLPLPERSEAKEIFLVPTLSPKSDHRA
jgi:MFS family permease